MLHKTIDSLTKATSMLRNKLPAKGIPKAYSFMVFNASELAVAQINDEIDNKRKFKVKIDSEDLTPKYHKLFQYHMQNQIEMFKINKN